MSATATAAGATDVKPPLKPAVKPKNLKFVRALFPYQGKELDELSFMEGDLLYVLDDTSDKGWWRARCRGKEGLIPANFVSNSNGEADINDFNPMHDACRRGNTELLQECLDDRAPVNAVDKAGNTPLHWACQAGQLECVEKLLAVPQVNASIRNRLGDMPLHQAAYKGHVEGSSQSCYTLPTPSTDSKSTAPFFRQIVRAFRSRTDTVKCNVNVKNMEGKTAFDLAQDPETKEELKKWIQSLSLNERSPSVGDYAQEDYEKSDDEDDE